MSTLITSADYYANKFPWTKINKVELDPTLVGTAFERHGKKYLEDFATSAHNIPAVIPYTAVKESRDYANNDAERINVETYILEPKKWLITKTSIGEIMGGDDRALKEIVTSDTEMTVDIKAGIEVTASTSANGSYGPLSYSAELKTHASVEYEKKTKTKVIQETTLNKKDAYLKCFYRAQLVCDVKKAFSTEFSMFAGGWAVVTTDFGKQAVDSDRLIYKLNSEFPRGKVDGIQADFGKTIEWRDNVKLWDGLVFTKRGTVLKVVPAADGTPLVAFDLYHELWETVSALGGQTLQASGYQKECQAYATMQKKELSIKNNEYMIDYNIGMPGGVQVWTAVVQL